MKLDPLAVARHTARTLFVVGPLLVVLRNAQPEPWHIGFALLLVGCFIELCGIADTLRIIGARHDKG